MVDDTLEGVVEASHIRE